MSDTPEKPSRPGTISEAESQIKNQAYETIFLFTQGGEFIYGNNGSAGSAVVEDSFLASVKDSVCIHNHPSGKRFSPQDMQFIRDLNPQDFRVVTPKKRFRLVRPDAGWPDEMLTVYSRWYATHYNRYAKNLKRGKITCDQFSARVFSDTLKDTVSEIKLPYTEEDL